MSSGTKGTALLTGASSGIYAIYADKLGRRGFDLILVARSQPALANVAAEIAAATGRVVTPFQADLANKDDLRKVESILRSVASIIMLVNNAGVGSVDALLSSEVDDMERMIDINVVALTRLVYSAAPAFALPQNGTIINSPRLSLSRRRCSMESTVPPRRSCWRLHIHSTPEDRSKHSPVEQSCGRRMLSTLLWLGWILANSSRFLRSKISLNGMHMRRLARG